MRSWVWWCIALEAVAICAVGLSGIFLPNRLELNRLESVEEQSDANSKIKVYQIIIFAAIGLIILPFIWASIAKCLLYFLYLMERAINYLNGHQMLSFYDLALYTLHSKEEDALQHPALYKESRYSSEKKRRFAGYRAFDVMFLIILFPISFPIGYVIYSVVLGYSLIFKRRNRRE